MLVAIDLSGIPYFEGRVGALGGEPLFPDADPEYARGWCAFHEIENPYSSPDRTKHPQGNGNG